MTYDKVMYGIAGLIIGGILVWFLTSAAVNQNNSGMMRMMGIRTNFQTTSAQNMMQRSGTIDAHFIEQMIPHHEDAITMSKLAQTRAQRPEIKELALNIIDSQSHEIEQMKVWYKNWFGSEVPVDNETMKTHGMGRGGMHMGMMGDETDMEALKNADDFDKEFIEQMIPHHQMAVMMASMLKNGTERPEMKKLAEDIITAQTKEIEQMRSWLKEWNNEQ